jgi:putative SOS response-associated peptidase YedK
MISICGRYQAITESEVIEIREIIREVSLSIANDSFDGYSSSTDEVFPTNNTPVIIKSGQREVSFENLRWGFKKWDGKGSPIINARAETLQIKSMFKGLLAEGRCVVPAGEYYEWEQRGREKVKHFIKDKEGNLLFMAGLYRESDEGREFVIITKDAYGDVAKIHDRMPVILRADQIELWLSGMLSPDDITKMDFNVSVVPCENVYSQLSLISEDF